MLACSSKFPFQRASQGFTLRLTSLLNQLEWLLWITPDIGSYLLIVDVMAVFLFSVLTRQYIHFGRLEEMGGFLKNNYTAKVSLIVV